jgi:hypothetical protein
MHAFRLLRHQTFAGSGNINLDSWKMTIRSSMTSSNDRGRAQVKRTSLRCIVRSCEGSLTTALVTAQIHGGRRPKGSREGNRDERLPPLDGKRA